MKKNSIVCEIWGCSDTVLFIFAGCAAEFSINKEVDWLYFTGKLPQDPLRRLFDTVRFAQAILFQDEKEALKAINQVNKAHHNVEAARGREIPQWAYRDVLYMLIDYTIKSFEITTRKLSSSEKEDVFLHFRWVGEHMKINELPRSYKIWLIDREQHLRSNTSFSQYSQDLYKQYRKHLGAMRYLLLMEIQQLILVKTVKRKLGLKGKSRLQVFVPLYQKVRLLKLFKFIQYQMMPSKYLKEIKQLNRF